MTDKYDLKARDVIIALDDAAPFFWTDYVAAALRAAANERAERYLAALKAHACVIFVEWRPLDGMVDVGDEKASVRFHVTQEEDENGNYLPPVAEERDAALAHVAALKQQLYATQDVASAALAQVETLRAALVHIMQRLGSFPAAWDVRKMAEEALAKAGGR